VAKVTRVVNMERCIGCNVCAFTCARVNRGTVSLDEAAIAVKPVEGADGSYTVILCRACEDPPCAAACPKGALVPRRSGGVRLRSDLCDSCGACVQACIIGAIHLDSEKHKPIVCIHCGACVEFCPHQVLSTENRPDA
jgi:Fe-S-cluster-containing dehydrogenase component